MTPSLLTTKLYMPPANPRLVPRPRLIRQLEEGLHLGHRLTLASAPAGFGKTTLLTEWLRRVDRPVAWLSLDEGDNDPARFLAYLVAALQGIEPAIGQAAQAMLQAPQLPPLTSLLTGLVNDVVAASLPFILVLDDYHTVEATPVHQAVSFLLEHLPPQSHLVIATRADPPLPIARLRGQGRLTEVHAADLRFSPDEVATFLNEGMGLALSAEQTSALQKRTEGWIVGLQLAALSLRGREDVSDFIRAFTGSQRYVLDYLTEEVLGRQPPEVRSFLLHTAILNRLTGPLCDAVTGRTDGHQILRVLEATNLFTIPLDGERCWYRYHHLFADFLRQRLQWEEHDLLPELHRRASEWYEQNGSMGEAVGHALTAGDFARAAGLIQQIGWETFTRGKMATILRWIALLPDDLLRAHPQLGLLHAWATAKSGQLDDVEACLRDVDPGLLPGEVTAVRAYVAGVRGDRARAIRLAQQALEHLPEESLVVRAIVTQNLGVAYHWSGDPTAAGRTLAQAVQLSRAAGQTFQTLTAMAILGRAQEVQGSLHQAFETYKEALALGTEPGSQPVPFAGMACVGLAGVLYEWNELDEAQRYALEGARLSTLGGFVAYQVFGRGLLARIYGAQGRPEEMVAALQDAERLGQGSDYALVMALVAELRVRLWLSQGNVAAAARWAQTRRPAPAGELDAGGEIEQMAVARVHLAQARPDEALHLLAWLLDAARAAGRMGSAVKILVLQALAMQAGGDPEGALPTLGRALALAEPQGYERTFVDEGEPLAQLLRRAVGQGMAPEYAARLLRSMAGRAALPAPAEALLVEPLTERELEVLRLIAAGLSNREIAQELVVAVSTVKSHVNHIYGKLDVKNRTRAVAKAQDLALL